MLGFVTQVGGLMKNLPSVAALTAERDGEIRKAALNTLATAYKNLGMYPPFSSLLIR
jgi:cytoskeleton-associated protein 5